LRLPWGNPSSGSEDESIFGDVGVDHPYYAEIKAMYDNDLISGTGNGNFSPDAPVTRAEAVTAFIRALGFENQGLGYPSQVFWDDASIPDWARSAFYTANSIGLVTPDAFGYVNANQVLTRAEAASLLHRFVTYLQNDLRYQYRDRVVNY
jgi:hypothetical protein